MGLEIEGSRDALLELLNDLGDDLLDLLRAGPRQELTDQWQSAGTMDWRCAQRVGGEWLRVAMTVWRLEPPMLAERLHALLAVATPSPTECLADPFGHHVDASRRLEDLDDRPVGVIVAEHEQFRDLAAKSPSRIAGVLGEILLVGVHQQERGLAGETALEFSIAGDETGQAVQRLET
ncbi:MAG: hypothetical protein ACO31E_11920 [Phycisphaerales bacterium]